jgi:histidine triad (HIT) family protein
MFNHEPSGYQCPFCAVLAGGDTVRPSQDDVVVRRERATALIASAWWPGNHGHVLVVPNAHYENLYDLPGEYAYRVHDLSREVAIALREVYGCEGVSTRQHNGPAGDQTVWHYHLHVFPRYAGDRLYASIPALAPPDQRREYAERLRAWFTRAAPAAEAASAAGPDAANVG